jgi:1-deoxy-D-xylulose-5-phosphate reductoisomerase
LNGSNEAAVAAFTSGKIRFVEISKLVAATIAAHQLQKSPSLDDLLQADKWARDTVEMTIKAGESGRQVARSPDSVKN